MQMRVAYVKENIISTGGLWLMQNTKANSARYMSLFDSDNALMTNVETLEQAGVTFYPHCIYCHDVLVAVRTHKFKGMNAKSSGIVIVRL